MTSFNKIRQEYDLKKMSVAFLFVVGIIGGIFAGVLLVQDRVDIRNQAANSCPVGSLHNVLCEFTVESSVPFTYVVSVTSVSSDLATDGSGGPFTITTERKEMTPTGATTTLTEVVPNVPFTGNYTCNVEVTATETNNCGSKTASDTGSSTIACTPPDGDTPTNTPTPTPDRITSPYCENCSRVEVKLDFNQPNGQQQPTLTPPSIYKDDLKIGRLTIEFKNPADCGNIMSCDDVEKIEFRAYDNASCSGQPDLTPIPLNSEGDDDYGRYGSSIQCSEAVISPGNDPYNEGARFRLHQARGAECRCYKVNVEFKKDAADKLVCPNMPKENICCSNECIPPEIIDDPDDPNDGCPGDPDGPRPPKNPIDPADPICYFVPQNSCPRINAETHFKSYTGGPGTGGYLGYDDDFAGAPDGNDQRVLDEEDHKYIYKDGGSYDVRLICDPIGGGEPQTCKKRLRMSCTDVPGGPGTPPGGGGGGGGTPAPTSPLACVVPDIAGICIDQPQPTQ